MIETGFTTASARCILAALAKLKPRHFDGPLTFEARPGEEKTVFIDVYHTPTGNRVEAEYPQEDAVGALFARAQQHLAEQAA